MKQITTYVHIQFVFTGPNDLTIKTIFINSYQWHLIVENRRLGHRVINHDGLDGSILNVYL